MSAGWIHLHRKLKDHWLAKDNDKLAAWIKILLSVNHSPAKIRIGGEFISLEPGQSALSQTSWARIFGRGWDRKRVARFFGCLESDHMVVLKTSNRTSILTVCNWAFYQTTRPANDPANVQPIGQPTSTNKNDKNEKNDKKRYGEGQNVLLTDADYAKLCMGWAKPRKHFTPTQRDWAIETLSSWLANGKNRKNHYACLRGWVHDRCREEKWEMLGPRMNESREKNKARFKADFEVLDAGYNAETAELDLIYLWLDPQWMHNGQHWLEILLKRPIDLKNPEAPPLEEHTA